jgi:hypothetical protein
MCETLAGDPMARRPKDVDEGFFRISPGLEVEPPMVICFVRCGCMRAVVWVLANECVAMGGWMVDDSKAVSTGSNGNAFSIFSLCVGDILGFNKM